MRCLLVQVVATEVSKASVAAARHNIAANAADNIFLARMSSEEFTETWRVKGTRNRCDGGISMALNQMIVKGTHNRCGCRSGFLRKLR